MDLLTAKAAIELQAISFLYHICFQAFFRSLEITALSVRSVRHRACGVFIFTAHCLSYLAELFLCLATWELHTLGQSGAFFYQFGSHGNSPLLSYDAVA